MLLFHGTSPSFESQLYYSHRSHVTVLLLYLYTINIVTPPLLVQFSSSQSFLPPLRLTSPTMAPSSPLLFCPAFSSSQQPKQTLLGQSRFFDGYCCCYRILEQLSESHFGQLYRIFQMNPLRPNGEEVPSVSNIPPGRRAPDSAP